MRMSGQSWRKNIWRLIPDYIKNNKKGREDNGVLAELKRLMCNQFFFSLTGSTWEDNSSPPISSKHQLWRLEAELSSCTCVFVYYCVDERVLYGHFNYQLFISVQLLENQTVWFPLPSAPQITLDVILI